MKFIDLHAQYQRIKPAVDAAIQKVLNHGHFILGPEVHELEEQLARYIDVKHCVAMANGTVALQVALMSLNIRPGDEVITSPFSFYAVTEVIVLLGATPVYVDIDPRTYNMDPKKLEATITPKTKAIIPVSLYGQCADFDAINAIAQKYNLPVIEDAAQSFGATYKNRKSGGLTTLSCTSFFPSKPLGTYGEGGACFTNNDELAQKMRLIGNHGQKERYNHITLGLNARLDSLKAAILIEKLKIFDDEINARQQVAQWYEQAFAGRVQAPWIDSNNVSAYAQYTIQVDHRDLLQKELASKAIPTAIHYPKGLHEQPHAISVHGTSKIGQFPMTEKISRRVISLPFHPYLTQEQVKQIAEAVLEIMNSKISV